MESIREKLERIKELAGDAQEVVLKNDDVLPLLSQIYREAVETLTMVDGEYDGNDQQNRG